MGSGGAVVVGGARAHYYFAAACRFLVVVLVVVGRRQANRCCLWCRAEGETFFGVLIRPWHHFAAPRVSGVDGRPGRPQQGPTVLCSFFCKFGSSVLTAMRTP